MKATALLLLLSAFVLAACIDFGDGEEPEPGGTTTPGPSPSPTAEGRAGIEEALTAYVRDELGQEYVGDCSSAQLPDDAGKLCTSFRGERDGLQAYVAGLTFSEFFTWLFAREAADGWQVVARFDIHEDAVDVPGVPWPLIEGAQVVVTGTSDCLNVREGPGLEAPAVDCLPDGTKVKLAQGPIEADGFQWWRMEGRAGWVAADWLRYADEAPPAADQTPPQ